MGSKKYTKKQRHQSFKDHPSTTNDSKLYKNGVLIVHGIGLQKKTETLSKFSNRLASTYRDLGIDAKTEPSTSHGSAESSIATNELVLDGQAPILIGEAHWADVVDSRRLKGTGGACRRLLFILKVLPFLLVATIMPRHDEKEVYDQITSAPRLSSFLTPVWPKQEWNSMISFLPTLWRMLAVIFILAGMSWFSTLLPWYLSIVSFAGALALLTWYLSYKHNLVEHIRMAAASPDDLNVILKTIRAAIHEMESSCAKVQIIAHSQGGYLTHQILAGDKTREYARIQSFDGIASGIRPIHLAATASTVGASIWAWCWLGASLWMAIGVVSAFEPGGFASMPIFSKFLTSLTLGLAYPFAIFDFTFALQDPIEIFTGIWGGWGGLLQLVSGILVLGVLAAVRPYVMASMDPIADIPKHTKWTEHSSSSDLVGSMSVPELPDRASVTSIPSMRQPLLDHGLFRYLGFLGSLRFELAARILSSEGTGPRTENTVQTASSIHSDLTQLSRQTYVLRGGLVLATIFLLIVIPFALGGSLTGQVMRTWFIVILSSLLGWVIAAPRWIFGARRIITDNLHGIAPSKNTSNRLIYEHPPLVTILFSAASLLSILGGLGTYLIVLGGSENGFSSGITQEASRFALTLMAFALLFILSSVLSVAKIRACIFFASIGFFIGLSCFIPILASDLFFFLYVPGAAALGLCMLISSVALMISLVHGIRSRT